jgi:hypothetical protein
MERVSLQNRSLLLCPRRSGGGAITPVDAARLGKPPTNPDLEGPRPFWQYLEQENAKRPAQSVLRGRLDLYA